MVEDGNNINCLKSAAVELECELLSTFGTNCLMEKMGILILDCENKHRCDFLF